MPNDLAPISPVGRLLSADDVADLFGVPRAFVYYLARTGGLPAVRVGERYVRFRAEAVAQWIANRESSAPERFS